jgi:hypothetical protein
MWEAPQVPNPKRASWQAGTIHRFSTTAVKPSVLTAFHSVGLLNVLQRVRLRWPRGTRLRVLRLVRPALSLLRDENL